MAVQQHVMAGQMVFREIDAPLEHVRVHGAGGTLVLAGDNLHPIAPTEPVVETHALEGIGLADAGARNGCQLVSVNLYSVGGYNAFSCNSSTFLGILRGKDDGRGFGES